MLELADRLERAGAELRRCFGYPAFRVGQLRAVRAALAGRCALVVLPTGGGKSVCYQVPALVLDGLTLVVSPLISLMQDQVDAARQRGIWAAALSSAMSLYERDRVLRDVISGGLKLLYVAPERLASGILLGVLKERGVSMIAVDEAHCVSEWGHDFRPEYRKLGLVREVLGRPPTLALTATATPAVQSDIARVLRFGPHERIIGSFDRPNLHFAVRWVTNDDERRRVMMSQLKPLPGASIVYVSTRVGAERWARYLGHVGLRAAPYHAGLAHTVRRQIQREFLSDVVDCIVATSAFGMGIDKPNVRLVLHMGLSSSLEAYYQEAGRAGRDGRKSRCLAVWSRDDVRLQRKIVPDSAKLDPLLRYLQSFGCRRERLLRHFGETMKYCNGCDRCERWAELWRRRVA